MPAHVTLENAYLRITLDKDTGAVVGLTNLTTQSEYLQQPGSKPPFIIDTYSANQAVYIKDPMEAQSGGWSRYEPDKSADVKGDLSHVRESVDGKATVTLEHGEGFQRAVCACELLHGIAVTYSITLKDDSPVSEWRIEVENEGGETPAQDQRVYRVAFPVLESLRIGDKPENDFLARPYAQGELIPNPSAYDYMRPNWPIPLYVLTYLGWASMPWQDLYAAEKGGLYFASYDLAFQQLDMETWPDKESGTISMDMRTLAFLEPGQAWSSQVFQVGVHTGDWHWGADQYRTWAHANHRPYTGPKWIREECDGWLGSGAETKSYRDYLDYYEGAKWLGLNYLQMWAQMISDVGDDHKTHKSYYCFLWPDPKRGGEAELTRVVRQIRSQGGHIGFYHNIWTWDSELYKGMRDWNEELPPDVPVPTWWDGARKWASVFPDGSREAGNFTEGYSGMCPAAKGYQDYVLSWVIDRYVKRYGVDTWYFDSMPVSMFAAARICFSDEHGCEQPHGIGPAMLEIAQRVSSAAMPTELAITSETVSDALMQYHSHALGVELIHLTRYPKPEIYTYTFTEHPIFSGSCNGAGAGLPYYYPDMTEPRKEDALNRVFLMGYRFDLLAWYEELQHPWMAYVRRLIALRQQIKADLYHSAFRDEIGLGGEPELVYAKLFRRNDGGSLIVNFIDRRKGDKAPFTLTIDLTQNDFTAPGQAVLHELDDRRASVKTRLNGTTLEIDIPALSGEVASLMIRQEGKE